MPTPLHRLSRILKRILFLGDPPAGRDRALEDHLHTFSETIGSAISRSRDLESGLQRCTEAMIEHLDLAMARIWVFHPEDDVLLLRASAGIEESAPEEMSRIQIGEAAVGKVAAERTAYYTNTICSDPFMGRRDWCEEKGLSSFAALPLLIEDRSVGVVAVFAKVSLEERVINALKSVADSIAVGIERKRVERALERNRFLFEAVIEQAGEGISIAGVDGRHILVNPAFCRMTGYSRDELLARKTTDLLPPEESLQIFHKALSGKSARRLVELVRKDGSRFSAEVTGYPLDIAEDRLGLAIVRDVTRELETEEQHRRMEEQLRLSQRMESVGQLAGGVAHDFNNLLLVILGHAELAAMQVEGKKDVVESLGEIKTAAEHAAVLTRQLLAFSRRQSLEVEILDLNEQVRGLLRILRRLIPENYEIEFLEGDELGPIEVDAGQLEHVLMNLVVNARDAMDESKGTGHLTIATENVTVSEDLRTQYPWAIPGPYVSLTVQDSGIGMSSEVADRIFEPFFTTKEAGVGTGMGLATVYGIVKQHSGMIFCESEPGKGTTFRIYFPRAVRSEPSSSPRTHILPMQGQETVLVAEDDESVRKMVSGILRQVGYQVLEADDGAEALQLFKENQEEIDLVLLDTVMPQLSGLDAYTKISELKPDIRVLFTSGYSPRRIPRELFENENFKLLLKPFGPADLLREVREAIEA
jgi:two-component system, cell cycle sensor histidine kinase and response regulator CckA